MSSRWRLEIRTEAGLHGALVSTHEFDDLPSLRVKMVEHRGGAFLVSPPDQATQTDLEALLDLRSQGFLIERISRRQSRLATTTLIASRNEKAPLHGKTKGAQRSLEPASPARCVSLLRAEAYTTATRTTNLE